MTRTLIFAFLLNAGAAYGSPCAIAPLSTYLNSGNFFNCTEANVLTVKFNAGILPSYVGLNLLSSNNASAPSDISVVPGSFGLTFNSSNFLESSLLLSSQSELVHFYLDGGTNPITQTTLSLNSVATSVGSLGIGTGLAIGQELLCVGGTFTSLPTGLVTSVANGLLGSGAFGCNGTALIGTAAVSSGPLSAITSILGLPDLTGLTDTATIQLSPLNSTQLDVIKLQALLSIGGGSASDTGFGNTYTIAATPEPGTLWLFAGMALLGAGKWTRLRSKKE
jgi:hypothetical protein